LRKLEEDVAIEDIGDASTELTTGVDALSAKPSMAVAAPVRW
jgi:hypothetical protein